MKGTRLRVVIGIAVAVGVAGVIIAFTELRGGDQAAGTRAFFAIPTPASCAQNAIHLDVTGTRISAFVSGSSLRSIHGKFFIVSITASGPALAAASDLASRFTLAEPSGHRYTPVSSPGGATAEAAGSTRTQQLVFDVPNDFAAAKLIFDDGCLHEEWLTP